MHAPHAALQADDVGTLVNVGVICYLKQLLDTGFFHADPHPGNLIRTPDGRLAILDFGLMTQVGAAERVWDMPARPALQHACMHGCGAGVFAAHVHGACGKGGSVDAARCCMVADAFLYVRDVCDAYGQCGCVPYTARITPPHTHTPVR